MLNSQLTTHFSTCFYQGHPRERFLILEFFPAGFSHHGNSRNVLDGNQPPREPFPRELLSHHGNSRDYWYNNRSSRESFPREPATAGTSHHGNSRAFMWAVSTSSYVLELHNNNNNNNNKTWANQNTSWRCYWVNCSISQTMTTSNLLTKRQGRSAT